MHMRLYSRVCTFMCTWVPGWVRGQSINQPPIEMIADRTGVWLGSLCQLFSCIVLLAGCLFKQLPVSHSTSMDAQPSPHAHTHAHTHTWTYCMLCNSKDCSPALHDRVEDGGLSVCLFVHLEVVCFVKHHSVTAGGDGGFGRKNDRHKEGQIVRGYCRKYIW